MKKLTTVLAMVAAAIAIPTALFAWGPSRPTYTIEAPADHVTFNSITNNPVRGDERNFFQVRNAGATSEAYVDNISLVAGKEYEVLVYFHNNAASNYNASGVGIAHGAYAKVQIPAIVKDGSTGTTAVGYVGASNAVPAEVWDNLSFSNTTGIDMALKYVAGSATIHSFGAVNGKQVDDKIVSTGAAIGYDSLNGELKGCNEFAGYITLIVKADQPNFIISKQVRKTGAIDWKELESVKPGDSIDYQVKYKNTGTIAQNDVKISDVLPADITYTAGSTYLANKANPSGVKVADGVISKDGINIGNYAAAEAAYIKFSATVDSNDNLTNCGINNLINTAKVTTENGSKEDTAEVTVTKVCTTPPVTPPVTPPELPKTGAGDGIVAILGLGATITSLGYYLASRRVLNR